jgi:hypothetical protein
MAPSLESFHTWLAPVPISLRKYIELGSNPAAGVVITFSGRLITSGDRYCFREGGEMGVPEFGSTRVGFRGGTAPLEQAEAMTSNSADLRINRNVLATIFPVSGSP